jgi:hypothetical protein
MDASELASRLNNLENSWSVLDAWLDFWTILVVVGVLIELIVVISEYQHDWRDFKRGVIHSPEQPALWIFILGLLGAALVGCGVAGEFFVHVKAGKLESDMRSTSRELVGIAQRDAGDANKAAGGAIREAAQLRKDAEGLKKQAEDERMARIQLAASISWRTPDRALVPQLALTLQRFANQRYAFIVDPGDPEKMNVIGWIGLLLGTASWRIETARSMSELTLQATNLVLWVGPTAPDGVLEAARAMVPTMERGGLPAVVLQTAWGPQPDAAPPEVIRIAIYRKGPRMHVGGNAPNGNVLTFDGSPIRIFLGNGPPH